MTSTARSPRDSMTRTVAPLGSGFSDQVVNSALRYRAQAPLIDELLREIGIDSGKSGPALATGLLKAASKAPKPEGNGS